jgi:hypothetical protein
LRKKLSIARVEPDKVEVRLRHAMVFGGLNFYQGTLEFNSQAKECADDQHRSLYRQSVKAIEAMPCPHC